MDFQVGDRVRSLITDQPGLFEGELGTVVKLRKGMTPIIEWDNFNAHRHSSYDNVPNGHGWFVYSNSQIELIAQYPEDLGDLSDAVEGDITKFLFDM